MSLQRIRTFLTYKLSINYPRQNKTWQLPKSIGCSTLSNFLITDLPTIRKRETANMENRERRTKSDTNTPVPWIESKGREVHSA